MLVIVVIRRHSRHASCTADRAADSCVALRKLGNPEQLWENFARSSNLRGQFLNLDGQLLKANDRRKEFAPDRHRPRRNSVRIGAALIFAVEQLDGTRQGQKAEKSRAADPAALAEGKQIYGKHCENCHGENGDGKGEKAPELSIAPRISPTRKKWDGITDGELFWQITKGRQPMPAFEDKLNDEERWELGGLHPHVRRGSRGCIRPRRPVLPH